MEIKYTNHFFWISLITIGLWSTGCQCDDCEQENSGSATPYDFGLSQHFSELDAEFNNTPENNPTTVEGVELGRHLFYDVRLSKNNTISCASCHKQEYAFTDPNRFSKGFEGQTTSRNSMSIVNMQWQRRFFWDARETSLENQVLLPIQDHIEMGMELDDVIQKLKRIKLYKGLFEDAFGDNEITSERISFAIAQFVRTIVSQNSKYDEVINMPDGKKRQALTPEEYLGYQLFKHVKPDQWTGTNDPGSITRGANCIHCHLNTLMTDNRITNNGLDSIYKENGFGDIANSAKWDATFKTPTLRNIELTAPYMHDGRFKTLEEVVDHYNEHIKLHENLSKELKEGGNHEPGVLHLKEYEKKALIAFMKTLTDDQLINDPKYANPFEE